MAWYTLRTPTSVRPTPYHSVAPPATPRTRPTSHHFTLAPRPATPSRVITHHPNLYSSPVYCLANTTQAPALGYGSSGYSTGFLRAYYSFDETMQLALDGIDAYKKVRTICV